MKFGQEPGHCFQWKLEKDNPASAERVMGKSGPNVTPH